MAATTTAGTRHPSDVGFAATLASEWTKLRTVRATYIQAFLAIGLSLGMSALIALAVGSTWDELTPEDQAEFDATFAGVFGTFFSTIVLVVLGVTFVSSEYTSGMMRTTLSATPQKGRVLLAKALIVLAVTLVLGLIIAVGTYAVSQIMLANYEGVPTASLDDDGVLGSLVGVWLTAPAFPLIGAAIGFILRSTASAITATLAILLVPSIFSGLLPEVIQENVLRFLPGNAGDHLIFVDPNQDSALYLDPVPAAIILVAWIVGFFAVAYMLLRARDV